MATASEKVVAVLKPGPMNVPAATVPAVLTDTAAAAAVPAEYRAGDPAMARHRHLSTGLPDLLRGTPGNLVTLGPDRVYSNGRWAARVDVWRAADRAILHDPVKLARMVERVAEMIGYSDRLTLTDGHGNPEVRGAVLSMLTPKAGAVPYERAPVVLDAPDVAEAFDDPSEFYRVYVGPGGSVVCVPDGYCEALGDPARLWPAAMPGCVTDGVCGFMVAGVNVSERVTAFLQGWARAAVSAAKAAKAAAPVPAAPEAAAPEAAAPEAAAPVPAAPVKRPRKRSAT